MKLKVMQSAAGFYLGTSTPEGFPNSRDSGYYYTRWEAAQALGDTIPVDKIEQEIEDELKKLVGNTHELAAKRKEFLEGCLIDCCQYMQPTCRWNYSVYATPENAIRYPS